MRFDSHLCVHLRNETILHTVEPASFGPWIWAGEFREGVCGLLRASRETGLSEISLAQTGCSTGSSPGSSSSAKMSGTARVLPSSSLGEAVMGASKRGRSWRCAATRTTSAASCASVASASAGEGQSWPLLACLFLRPLSPIPLHVPAVTLSLRVLFSNPVMAPLSFGSRTVGQPCTSVGTATLKPSVVWTTARTPW